MNFFLTSGVQNTHRKIHEGGDASGSQVFPDEPLCPIPVEALCGVSDARKMNTCFVAEKQTR